ncbi:hypothetical protein [Sphingobacterium sp. UBA5980]|uniref:hypothetical protein n=1 Tax=Sphingobacterium sp. UBA5980 TaxID=1947504 RepID=UPI00257FAF93|nr:hypothetical protein [Sphingobacterium sp. UBA5980]
MDNTNFQLLLELLERESSARIAAEEARLAENVAFQQTLEDLDRTIKQLNDTVGLLLKENRLLKGPKKNSSNSSVPPSKGPDPPKRTSSLRKSSGKSSGGQTGHDGSTLQLCSTPDVLIDHRSDFWNCCGLDLVDQPEQLASRRQVVDIPSISPLYTEHRVF